jgi:S1-C subfamily serine protease
VFEVEAGTGSGFVWDDAGHIVTNFHVIQGASSAQVVFSDQSSYDAILVGVAPEHDLAVLRVQPDPSLLRPLMIGRSDNLQVGQAVFAIGNPFGLDQTLTTGVVSAKSRRIEAPSGRSIEGAIQIDAAINPGNSGGPLLDSSSRLIGVNTAIFSPSGASAGVGFAIPVDTVKRVVPQIIATGKYEPPRLGIVASDEISRAIAVRTGVQGIAIIELSPNSVAEQAGLRTATLDPGGSLVLGDILQAVDDYEVRTLEELGDALDEFDVGDTVKLKILREGKPVVLEVTLQ